MKNNRIKNITIQTIPITGEKRVQIESVLSRIYANHTTKTLDNMPLSNGEKADILREIIDNRLV